MKIQVSSRDMIPFIQNFVCHFSTFRHLAHLTRNCISLFRQLYAHAIVCVCVCVQDMECEMNVCLITCLGMTSSQGDVMSSGELQVSMYTCVHVRQCTCAELWYTLVTGVFVSFLEKNCSVNEEVCGRISRTGYFRQIILLFCVTAEMCTVLLFIMSSGDMLLF